MSTSASKSLAKVTHLCTVERWLTPNTSSNCFVTKDQSFVLALYMRETKSTLFFKVAGLYRF